MRVKKDNTGIDILVFAEKVCKAVSMKLGDGYQIKLQEVTKNNGVILQGLVILAENRNVSPTIYLNSFLNAYESGMPLAEIVRRILQIYREDSPREDVDMSFFREYGRVKDRICYKLLNREKNRVLLERAPHIDFLDLSICFYYAYNGSVLGTGSILIHNNHMDMWACTTTDLLKAAQENTPRIFPWEIRSMEELLMELAGAELGEGLPPGQDLPMYVLSNSQRVQGAACILYPGLLDHLAKEMKSSFYILPSSVHETILLRDGGIEDTEALRNMVAEVNATQVEPEELLSDNLYYYDRLEERIGIV